MQRNAEKKGMEMRERSHRDDKGHRGCCPSSPLRVPPLFLRPSAISHFFTRKSAMSRSGQTRMGVQCRVAQSWIAWGVTPGGR